MEDENTKKLTKILTVIIIIVMIIITISLASTFSKTDIYGYEEPWTTTTTTTKSIDKPKEANELDKVKYNIVFDERDFIIPMNIILNGKLDLDNINLLQSDESRFIYSYISLNKEYPGLEEINSESMKIFNYKIDPELIKKYLTGQGYYYQYEENPKYCFKLKNIQEETNTLKLFIDILNYNEEKCSIDELNYDNIKEGLLVYNKVNNNNYIDSFSLIKEEN